MDKQEQYKKLPGRGYAYFGFGRSSLWLGSDHLLLITRRGYTEEYKRFYYSDIRAIVIRRNRKYLGWNIALGSLSGFCLLILALGILAWNWDEPGLIAWSLFSGIFLVFLTIHLAKGPTCSTQLFTAVHIEPLPSMNRLARSLKVMRMLGPRIEAAQGMIARDQLLAHAGFEAPPQSEVLRPIRYSPPELTSNYGGSLHLVLFIILIADSIISAISIFQRTNFFQIANLIVFIALWGTCVAALIMQRRSRLSAGVKGLAWGSFCYLGLMLLLGYVYSMVVMFNNPAAVRTQWDMTKAIWNASPLDSPVLLAISIFSVASSTSLGIAGLIAWLRMKRMPASPTVQPAETSAGGMQ